MARAPTNAQLRTGAAGISYRAQQLADIAVVMQQHIVIQPADQRILRTISNALIESALTDARVLARFFQAQDVNREMYLKNWQDPFVSVAPEVWSTISQHASHAMTGSPEGEQHPGAWPIPELAVALVGALSRFVMSLRATDDETAAWFIPNPVAVFDDLIATEPHVHATEVSKNPTVGKLTTLLQLHLAEN